MLIKKQLALLIAATILAAPPSYAASSRKAKAQARANAAMGEMLAQSCMACHGPLGGSIASPMPSIGGQSDAYLEKTLTDYRDGHRPSTVMGRLMKGYSDDEIKIMSAYLYKQPWILAKQTTDAAQVSKGAEVYKKACKDCHENHGRESAEVEYPLLAGQWLTFMQISIADVISGKHEVDEKFAEKINELSPEQVDAALHYFASQK